MTAPSFSIVVPAYNAAKTLPAAIASLRAQTDRDYEVIIVNDGSTDATGEIAERLARDEDWVVLHQENAGLPAARNAAIRASRGRWLAFLDSDDLLMPEYVKRMRALLESRPSVGLAYRDAWMLDDRRGRVYRRSTMGPYRPNIIPETPEEFFRALMIANFVWVGAAAPRATIEDLGGFDETLSAAEDWQMWMRIAAAGYVAVGTADRLGIYRRSPGQMSADPIRMLTGRLAALRSLHTSCRLTPSLEIALRERELEAEQQLTAARPRDRRRVLTVALGPVINIRHFPRKVPRDVATVLAETGALNSSV